MSSSSDLTRFTPDEKDFGVSIARTLRIIARLLFDWSAAERRRREKSPEIMGKSLGEDPYLKTIYFDKLVTFFCRLWNQLHEKGYVGCRSGFYELRGFHGPGQALKINRLKDEEIGMGRHPEDIREGPYAYITEIIEKLDPGIGYRKLFKVEGSPGNPECKVYPQLDGSLWDSWCFKTKDENDNISEDKELFLRKRELAYVLEISSSLSQLSSEEIRAIGTHCSATNTCRDIDFNLAKWQESINHILDALIVNIDEVEYSAHRLVTTSREIQRKSIDNKVAYKNAFTKFFSYLTTPMVSESFLAAQKNASDIWGDDRVLKYANIAPILLAFSTYCKRVLSILRRINKLSREEEAESNELFTPLQRWCQQRGLFLLGYELVQSKSNAELGKMLECIKSKIILHMPASEDTKDTGIV